MGHSYTWIVGSGTWGTAADWADLTASQNPSLTAPGTADNATIKGPATATTYIVTGPGSIAGLTLDNSVALDGSFTATTVAMTTLGSGTVNLLAGATLAAGSLIATSQVLSVDGAGAALLDSGTLSLQGFEQVEASNGGFISAGLVAMGSGAIAVDPAGTFEVGTAGGAPAGTISVDAGADLQAAGNLYGPVLVNGLVNGNAELFNGPVSGTGTISVAASARFENAVAAGVNVVFPGFSGDLTLVDPAEFAATISGFRQDDVLAVNAPGITSVSYSGNASGGALALLDGGTTLENISLSGDYTASTFLLLPFGGAFANANIGIDTNQATTPAAAPADPGNSSPYAWSTDTGGAWNNAANWGGAAPPGSLNAVTIASAISGMQIINGDGNSASMTLTGQTALNGVFNTGTLTLNITLALIGSTAALMPGSVLNATATNLAGNLEVDGATLSVSGTLAVGNSSLGSGSMFIYDQGFAHAAALALGINSSSYGSIGIDPGSTLEIGNAGAAAAGALTVDAGATAEIAGEIDGNVVNNGLILANSGIFGIAAVLKGAISGTGTIELAPSGHLTLQGNVAAGGTIAFGFGAILGIQAPGTLAAVLTGFATGDSIASASTEVAGVLFSPGTGALVLTGASGDPLVTLDMAGSFTGNSFLALPTDTQFGASSTVVLAAGVQQVGAPPAPAPGTPDAETYTWTAFGGVWGTAANWSDTTAGQPVALFAPGSNDLVTIPDSTITPGGWQVISGAGNAASLTITGNVALSGDFAPTALTVTGGTDAATIEVGSLDVLAGAHVVAASASVTGNVLVNGAGASLGVAGVLTLNGALNAVAHASVVAGGLTSTSGPTLFVDPTATIEIGTAGGADVGALNIDAGVTVTTAGLTLTGEMVNNGRLVSGAGSSLTLPGTVSGTGVLALAANGFARLTGSVAATQTLTLAAGDSVDLGTLALPTIVGFAPGDTLSFETDVTGATWNGGTLTLTTDGVPVETLAMAGNYAGAGFIVTPAPAFAGGPDPGGFTPGRAAVTLASAGIACFATGTRIATPDGPVPVEALRVGDRVVSAFGGSVVVRWIGHRTLDCRRHPRPAEVLPVRVRAGAFGDGLPRRDLLLSPDHAVFVGGRLMPVRYLINGATVVQEAAGRIKYWHIELPAHDVILAEGLPAESYLDTGNRSAFANGGGVVQAQPDFALRVWEAEGCAPLVVSGAALAGVQAALLARAEALGFGVTDEPDLRLLVEEKILRPVRVGALHRFDLPPGAGAGVGVLASRDFVPAWQWPGNDDHRRLGVSVARLALDGREVAPAGTGWYAAEPAFRWTDGGGAVALDGARVLDVTLAMTGRYWVARQARGGQRASGILRSMALAGG